MKQKEWLAVILVVIVVAVVSSLITGSLTGNVIKLNENWFGKYPVYTKTEIDTQFNNCSVTSENSWNKSCQGICDTLKKKCLLGQYFIENYGEQRIFLQRVVGCADVPGAHYSRTSQIPAESDTGLWCVCC